MALPWRLLLPLALSGALGQRGAVQGCVPPPAAYNAALGRPASQSSVFPNRSIAANAVDGNRDGAWPHGSCARTLEEPEPWWAVDLGARHAVAAVLVQNRRDCCWEQLQGAQVHVGDAAGERASSNPVCGVITDAGPGSLSTVCCEGLQGRYVSVSIPGREEQLALCEVEVYGTSPGCCGTIADAGPGSLSAVCCHGLRGRYVSVLLPGRTAALALCEVEVLLQGCAPPPGAPNAARGRPAAQSSTLDGRSLAANAVDGDGDWERGSCSRTEQQPEPWWRVDLGRRRAVHAVTLANRRDCCWQSLVGAQVHVGDSPADGGKRNPLCGAVLDAGPGSASTVCCRGLPGRYVSVVIPGRVDALALCEVEVTARSCVPPPGAPNLALRRPAAQSSTAPRAGAAANAVDGHRDGAWRQGSCSQTAREPEPWWTVDLGRRRAVAAVVVRNRLDCCWHRLKGARVHVGDSLAAHGTGNPVCGTITDTGPGSTSTVCCRGLRGRYVSIAVPGREERLSLCEVEVLEEGCAPLPGAPNAALGRPAAQSSVLDAASGAGNAVDGSRDGDWARGSCAHTLEEPEPWWRVDLGARRAVYAVLVQNRRDCCWEQLKGAEVRVGDSPDARGRRHGVCGIITDAGPGSLSTVCCHGLRGRYVSVLLPGRTAALALCEVEVLLQGCAPPPGGHVLSRQSMEAVIRLADEENLLLLADEVGARGHRGVRHPPVPPTPSVPVPQVHQDSVATPGRPFLSFKRVLCEMGAPLAATVQLVSFYSLSKGIAGEGGFRAGFFELVNIDPGVLKCFYTWGLSVYPPILGQILLHTAMELPGPEEPCYAAFAAEEQAVRSDLARKARLVQDLLARAPGIRCQPVQGGARAFPHVQLPPRAVREAQ
ncbi:alanine aminotransferase 1, partial [Apteryx rowi]|uniref:alanine aminotransferase 1 n=1 Tax=Apteryx rowi TaxID=308060 RepID=UPI000E1D87D6